MIDYHDSCLPGGGEGPNASAAAMQARWLGTSGIYGTLIQTNIVCPYPVWKPRPPADAGAPGSAAARERIRRDCRMGGFEVSQGAMVCNKALESIFIQINPSPWTLNFLSDICKLSCHVFQRRAQWPSAPARPSGRRGGRATP